MLNSLEYGKSQIKSIADEKEKVLSLLAINRWFLAHDRRGLFCDFLNAPKVCKAFCGLFPLSASIFLRGRDALVPALPFHALFRFPAQTLPPWFHVSKRYTTEDKIRILAGGSGEKGIQDVCREENISEVSFHG